MSKTRIRRGAGQRGRRLNNSTVPTSPSPHLRITKDLRHPEITKALKALVSGAPNPRAYAAFYAPEVQKALNGLLAGRATPPVRGRGVWRGLVRLGMEGRLAQYLQAAAEPPRDPDKRMPPTEWKKVQVGLTMGGAARPLLEALLFEWAGFELRWCQHKAHWFISDDPRRTDCPEHRLAGQQARWRERKDAWEQAKAGRRRGGFPESTYGKNARGGWVGWQTAQES